MIYLLLIFNSVLIACSGGETDGTTEKPTDPVSARKQLKEKKQALRKLQGEIAELEAIINDSDTTTREEKKITVAAKKVPVKTFKHYVEVQGTVAPINDPAFASSETGGRLVKLKVREGDYVKKGDTIAIVDLESIRKSMEEIDKSLELAEDMYKRQEALWKKKIGSEMQFLQAKNQVESLQKTRGRLEFELSKANVYAPASGHIDMVRVKTGEIAGPGTPIVQILNTSALKVQAAVPEMYLGAVRKGENIRINFPALDEEQNVRVSMIGRTINPNNRTFEIEAGIRNNTGLIKPNLLATIFINDYTQEKAVVVPDEYILQDVSGKNYVMIQQGNKAMKRFVTLGQNYQNQTVISTGLDGTETLITRGARSVSDGDLIEIIEDNTASAEQ
ncbi:MAG: efflux RND transporter periplasmic adaptor subunit [Aureispira sp.]|nr:efflux RND transporter periplasmic adaptor subunit [Aureispira sp.]